MGTTERYEAFVDALQQTLKLIVDQASLRQGVHKLSSSDLPFDVFYYTLQASYRVPTDGNKLAIHIDEDRWHTQTELLLSRLAASAGQSIRLHARDTVIARVDRQVALTFQTEHHLQVALPGKYRYGAFHQGELVAIAVFSGGRRMNNKPESYRSFELLRFCNKQGHTVIGVLSKLLNTFRKDFHPGDVMTYVDKDWSDGNRYEKLGFVIESNTAPQLFWVSEESLSRFSEYDLPGVVVEKPVGERIAMGYFPVYNNGSLKLVKAFKS